MKGTGYVKENGTPEAGDTNIVAGVTFIFSGEIWLPYPETAHELTQLAQMHGWGFDDGLPPRKEGDGTVYIRILLGREAGENAHGDMSPGIQYHITWRMPSPLRPQERGKKSWALGSIYMKTSEISTWQLSRSVKGVRGTIEREPVVLPSGYVPVNA